MTARIDKPYSLNAWKHEYLCQVFFDAPTPSNRWEYDFCILYERHRMDIYDASREERYLNDVFKELWLLTRECTRHKGKRRSALRELALSKHKSMVECAKKVLAERPTR